MYWSQPFKLKANLSIPTPRLDGDRLLVTSFYNGSMMLKLTATDGKPAAAVVWKGKGRGEQPNQTDGLHTIMSTPYIQDGYIYGVCSYGQLRCLKEEDGKRVWEDLRATGDAKAPTERWANAFLTPQGDRFFLFNEKGDLIIARLTPKGYEEIDRAHLLEPTNKAMQRDGGVVASGLRQQVRFTSATTRRSSAFRWRRSEKSPCVDCGSRAAGLSDPW